MTVVNSYVHVKALLCASLAHNFGLLALVLEPGLFFVSLSLFTLQVQMLIGLFEITDQISLGALEVILEHPSHSI
jgi:hypothetical protein